MLGVGYKGASRTYRAQKRDHVAARQAYRGAVLAAVGAATGISSICAGIAGLLRPVGEYVSMPEALGMLVVAALIFFLGCGGMLGYSDKLAAPIRVAYVFSGVLIGLGALSLTVHAYVLVSLGSFDPLSTMPWAVPAGVLHLLLGLAVLVAARIIAAKNNTDPQEHNTGPRSPKWRVAAP